jgi:hypothetical protein
MARVSIPTAAALMLFGCADHGGEGMVILENTAAMGTTCMLTGDPTQPTLSAGQIVAGSPEPYLLTPLIESRISDLGSDDEIARTILLDGADISLQSAGTTGSLAPLGSTFTSVFSGSIPPGGTVNVSFEIIPASVLNMITTDTEVVANITVHGTEGGGTINAEPFTYGVTVCTDCVVNVLTGADGTTKDSCSSFTSTVRPGNPCNPFQDGAVDCCMSGSGALVCPAVAGP